MTKIIRSEDCGNSPKNIFLEKLTIAIAKGDAKFILRSITEDARWTIVGERVIEGQEALAESLERIKHNEIAELTMYHIATHGKAGAVNGRLKLKGGRTQAFCNVYEFGNAKGVNVREITSYVIEIR
jgi:hypothetical protein